MTTKTHSDSVCCVVVAYNPPPDWTDFLRTLVRQSGQVVVVANSPLEANPRLADCRVIQNSTNLGIARALNQGLEAAEQAGFQYALLFDQDSRVTDDFLSRFLRVLDTYSDPEKLAVFKARHREQATAAVDAPLKQEGGYLETPTAITSGSLLPVKTWRNLGGFREDFFIDHVDHEYCLRAWVQGYRVAETTEVLMDHRTGDLTPVKVAGREFYPMHQPATRWYYGIRNLVALHRTYGVSRVAWLLEQDLATLKRGLKMCLWEKGRKSKLGAALRGFKDGWQM